MVEVSRGNPIWALGLMSGTSMDGVDAAMVLTDGETVAEFGETAYLEHPELLVDEITRTAAVFAECNGILKDSDGAAFLASESLEDQHLQAVEIIQKTSGDPIDVIGMHGHTIFHAPEDQITVQLGWGDRLARTTGIASVWDFRTQDVQAGGQGAPLAPFYHFALAKHIEASEPVAFLNIGGVANVTWIDPSKSVPTDSGALIAFDTGPGNALLNDWMKERAGASMDADGSTAAQGKVLETLWEFNSVISYLAGRPPKSLDRNNFTAVLTAMKYQSVEDGAATLTAFTVDCIAASLAHMPSPPTRWLVCGGGRKNLTMMRMLAERLDAPVDPVEAVGLDGDMLEAQAFAYLAVRVLRGLPTSAPGTTGCREPVCGGRISYP